MVEPVACVDEHRLRLGQGRRLGRRVFFVNLVGVVRLGPGDDGSFAAWPSDLDREALRLAGREATQRLVAGEVAAAGDHFLRLLIRPAANDDARADAACVAARAAQRHRHAGRGGVVAIEQRRLVEAVHHHVLVPVVVEVAQRNAVRDVFRLETPLAAGLCEAQAAVVAKNHVGDGQRRVQKDFFACLRRRQFAEPGGPLDGVEVLRVERMAVGDQQILKAVEVHVEEGCTPGPLCGSDTAEVGCVHVAVVTPVHEERVAVNDRPVDQLVDRLG